MDNNNLLITLGRQFGSGGREVGQILANDLGIAFYDKELIYKTAKKGGFDVNVIENAEEIANNSLIYSLSMGFFPQSGDNVNILGNTINKAQNDVIRSIADKSSCVIVGRCADYVLKDYKGCMRIFIKAPMDIRLKRAKEKYGMKKSTTERDIRRIDHKRSSYYNCYAGGSWGASDNYDLIVDTGVVGVFGAVDVIKSFVSAFRQKRNV